MHGPIKVKSPNNTSKWQMAFKGLGMRLGPNPFPEHCHLSFKNEEKKRNSGKYLRDLRINAIHRFFCK
jgi:hypothetical protein